MSVIPTVSADGVGAIAAGQLNAYQISCYNTGILRTVVGQTGMSVILQGTNIPNDGGQGNFYWDYTSTATDNNSTVIRPYGVIYGAWIKSNGFINDGTINNATINGGSINAMDRIVVGTITGPNLDGTNQIQSYQNQSTYSVNGSLGAGYFQRLASYTGGAAGDSSAPVVGAARGYNQIQATVTHAVETGGLFVADNYSWLAQVVGVTGQANSWLGGRVWGGVFEGHEKPQTFAAIAGQTIFVVTNGYAAGTATVLKNGALLTRTTDYVDSSGTNIVLTSGATAGDIITVWRGAPLLANIGTEIDVFAGTGPDNQNPISGNRVISGLFGYREDKTFNVNTHIGSGLQIIADPSDSYLTIDRGIGFQGKFVNPIDFNAPNLTVTGNAINMPSNLNIAIGTTATTFPVEISGNTTSMPNGVQARFTDSTSTSIDTRVGAVGVFNVGVAGTYSAHDFVIWCRGVERARATASGFTITGTLGTSASTTSLASLNIPAGTAPTSPSNGDIWFDGTNLKIRIGGVTKTFTVV
jgi:hypothetical protein